MLSAASSHTTPKISGESPRVWEQLNGTFPVAFLMHWLQQESLKSSQSNRRWFACSVMQMLRHWLLQLDMSVHVRYMSGHVFTLISPYIYIYTCILPIQCENRWFAETPHLKELIRGFVFLCLWIFSLCFYSCPPHVTRPEVAECLFVVWCLSLSQESQPQWDSSTVLISRDLLWSNFTLLPWVHAHMDVTCSLMNSLSYQGRMTHLYVETLKKKVLLKTSNGSCLFFFWPIPETERWENQYKGLFSQFK